MTSEGLIYWTVVPISDTYETADGKWIAIGSIEPQFYAFLLKHTGIDDPDFQDQMNQKKWAELKRQYCL